jgi:hypothetical protein
MATIFRWVGRYEDFREKYERAQDDRTEFHAEQLLEIADDGQNDYMEKIVEVDGEEQHKGWVQNGEHIQRSRLRVDTRKWILSKMKPKKYGDRTILEGGEDPIKTQEISDLDAARRVALMLAAAAKAEKKEES